MIVPRVFRGSFPPPLPPDDNDLPAQTPIAYMTPNRSYFCFHGSVYAYTDAFISARRVWMARPTSSSFFVVCSSLLSIRVRRPGHQEPDPSLDVAGQGRSGPSRKSEPTACTHTHTQPSPRLNTKLVERRARDDERRRQHQHQHLRPRPQSLPQCLPQRLR